MLDKCCRGNKTHFSFSNFSLKLCRLVDNVENSCTERQSADGNMMQAHCRMQNWG